jgi:hypothetical protein
MRLIEFILMLAGALLWTAALSAALAYLVYKLVNMEDKE